MRIYSMTATFGKLEHQTLTLKPGLNVIHAPNEWGKSTWCAFLLAMLYGLDTRAKATRASLPDKERYAPWSGSPMSGRIDLNLQGRDITIERSTKGRIPLGTFRAYETHSGMEVPELNGANCGQLLLGVERSVFQRAGFIRQSELPVTQDEALRRRLNALVTTGDESGDGARLEKGLRELKNRCRYNRSGLLPQAQQQCADLESTLEELRSLKSQLSKIQRSLAENANRQESLSNHAAALAYEKAQAEQDHLSRAEAAFREAQARLRELEAECADLPSLDEMEQALSRLQAHRQELDEFQEFQRSLPLPPAPPQVPACFLGLTPEQAKDQAGEDAKAYWASSPWQWVLFGLGALCLIGSGALFFLNWLLPGAVCGFIGCLAVILALVNRAARQKQRKALARRYGSPSPQAWLDAAEAYQQETQDYRRREAAFRNSREALSRRRQELANQHQALCGDAGVESCCQEWEMARQRRLALEEAKREAYRAGREYETLKAMVRPVPPPSKPDVCTLDLRETAAQLEDLRQEAGQLQGKAGQYRGRIEALGSEEDLNRQLEQVNGRIRALEQYDAALTLAQQTLTAASSELQRRFAPRICQGAQAYLSRLTLGRYRKLTLGTDFSLGTGAAGEDTLRDALWRSDGTADQLYLALRLSVARELTPEAPLILDDALVRFDEDRVRAALDLLTEIALDKQVLLFTCQQREEQILSGFNQPVI